MKKTWTARSAAFVLSAALAGQTLATGFVPQNVQAAQEGTQESTTETGKLIDMKAAIEPVKASYGYYVDVYQTNTSANLTPESNASIGVLSKMLDIFTPGDDWNTGTVLDQTTHQANLDKVKEITANRTEEEKTRAYLDDRRNQNYSMTEGLGGYAQTFIDGAEVQTSITDTIPEDATTVKYDDAYGDNAPWANIDGTYGNIAKLVNTIRGGAASTSSAKKYYKYMRPFRWLDDSVILDTLVPCKKADPSNDGGYPSGHTNAANLAAIGMAYAVPERYQELLTRASELGYDRIVAGMHSPLDVMGGRVMSTAIAAANLYDADNADVKSAAVKDGQALVQTKESGMDRFSDYGQNKNDYTDRLTYGFAQTGDTTKAMRVPKGAEVLLESRLPYLTADQRREVLYTTGLPSGYPVLDDEEGWGRLNLFAAADGYGALYSDVTVDMDAANGGFSAADEWKNDIAGGGSLTKEGSGSLTLSGNNSYTGGTDIKDGTIDAADDTALGTGNVTNEAELDVDSTLQVGGDYTQSTDASLKLHAAAKEALQIDGNAALSGELIVEVQEIPADGIALIQCDGMISGTFDKVTVNGVKGDFTLKQNGDTLSLVEEKYEVKNDSFEADAPLQLTKTAGVAIDTPNPDGGVAEITAYNSDTHEAYVVDGQSGDLKIVPVKEDGTFGEAKSLSVENLIEGFTYGDMTSVSVDTIHDRIAIALQAADYAANGQAAVLDYDGNLIAHYEVGVQPDMVTFTKDGNKILTADEGEPRNGYGEGTVDPAGSVTVIEPDKESDNVVTLGFDKFTADNLTQDHILLNKVNGTAVDPKTDLEPEYIAVNDKGTKAYVSLQEANAIAVVDLTKNEISEIKSLGFVDFSKEENAIDLIADDQYDAKTYPDTYGVRMPDGISLYEKDGKTYLLTTNEGDSREWGEEDSSQYFSNEKKVTVVAADQTKAKKVRALDPDMTAGSEDGKTYLYGSRSFSIFDTDTMELVYDSANAFEQKTAEVLAKYFNCSNDDNAADGRSQKKGPEPESVVVGMVGGKAYAFTGLERIGGVMVYDITDPEKSTYVNYINTRDFKEAIAGDDSPEGLAFVPANDTLAGQPMLLAACEVSGTLAGYTISGKAAQDAVVLYTNDVHCGISGYSSLAAYSRMMTEDGYRNILVDGGDAIQGEAVGALTKGAAIVDLMNQAGYELAVPGNHEFDYGMKRFLEIADTEAAYDYISANFIDLKTDKSVFDGYEIKDVAGKKIAFVGISTPETYTKSSPAYFQDENGNYIYSFSENTLYDTIQKTIDEAKDAGADYVVAVAHTGIEGTTDAWKSTAVIANTTGIDVYLDGHSHETIEGNVYQNKDGRDVILSSTGTKFETFGKLSISADGKLKTELIKTSDVQAKNESSHVQAAYQSVQDLIDKYEADITEELKKTIGTSEVELTINDAKAETPTRRIRNGETNLGDFVADAYKTVTGADIALVNGGGIRATVAKGDISSKSLMDVNPWNNAMCVIEATGQQIADALEHGAKNYPSESGGFLQVAGLTYEINQDIKTSPVITDDKGMFESVDTTKQRRVSNIKVAGSPIDLTATYRVAGSCYTLLEGGDGYTMFAKNKVLEKEGLVADAQMLIDYFTNHLNGTITAERYGNPYGEGRIQIVSGQKNDQKPSDDKKDDTSKNDSTQPKDNTKTDNTQTKDNTQTTTDTNNIVAEKVTVDQRKLTLGVKETYTLHAVVTPNNASDQSVTYKSDKPSVVSVSKSGKLTAKKKGTAKITVSTANGKTAVCKVTVKAAPKKVSLKKSSISLKKKGTYRIKVKLPKNTASNKITFRSANKKIAKVSANGTVTAVKKGKTTITVKTFNGKKTVLKVKVK